MEYLDKLLAVLMWLWAFWQVKFILAHVGINVTAAVAATIYSGEFVLAKTGEFLYRKALPFVLLFGVAAALGEAADLGWLSIAAWAALELILLGDLADNLARLGLSLPEGLTKKRLL